MLPTLNSPCHILSALYLSVLLAPHPAAAGARPGKRPKAAFCDCYPDIHSGRYKCVYKFDIILWGMYPCGQQFIKDAEDYCDRKPDSVMYSDIKVQLREFVDDYHCATWFSIHRPFCVEEFVKESMRCDEKFNGVKLNCFYDTEEDMKQRGVWHFD